MLDISSNPFEISQNFCGVVERGVNNGELARSQVDAAFFFLIHVMQLRAVGAMALAGRKCTTTIQLFNLCPMRRRDREMHLLAARNNSSESSGFI